MLSNIYFAEIRKHWINTVAVSMYLFTQNFDNRYRFLKGISFKTNVIPYILTLSNIDNSVQCIFSIPHFFFSYSVSYFNSYNHRIKPL